MMRLFPFFHKDKPNPEFVSSAQYWEERYTKGGDSGSGSQGRLAKFKADTVNRWIRDLEVKRILEMGCGDGSQLALAKYPEYIGVDVSPAAIERCRDKFKADQSKRFVLLSELLREPSRREIESDMVLSLDVIFHLVEDSVFEEYMSLVFRFSSKYVVIYSSNIDLPPDKQVRHRKFTEWVASSIPSFTLIEQIANRYPFRESDPNHTSNSEFFLYRKENWTTGDHSSNASVRQDG